MTLIEQRLVHQLWFILFGRIDPPMPQVVTSQEYQLLSKLYWETEFISPEQRQQLVDLAWKHRAKLPADLVLAAALKGGLRM